MKYNLKGVDQLEKNLSELSGTHLIPLDDLMTPSFTPTVRIVVTPT